MAHAQHGDKGEEFKNTFGIFELGFQNYILTRSVVAQRKTFYSVTMPPRRRRRVDNNRNETTDRPT